MLDSPWRSRSRDWNSESSVLIKLGATRSVVLTDPALLVRLLEEFSKASYLWGLRS